MDQNSAYKKIHSKAKIILIRAQYLISIIENCDQGKESDYEIDSTEVGSITIGDGVGEAGTTNATSLNVSLYFWSGAAWILKKTYTATGDTLGLDMDLTDGGTYPDATGFWQLRVLTNSADSDFLQGIVKVKHEIDN